MPLEMLALVGGQLVGGAGAPVSVETRDPILWPFSSSSIWNTPIGDAISVGALSSALAINFRSVVGQLNSSTFSLPVNRAVAGDPAIIIREVATGTWRPSLKDNLLTRAPAVILLAGDLTTVTYNNDNSITFGGLNPDASIAIIDEVVQTVTEGYKVCWDQGGPASRILLARLNSVHTWDLKGDGWTQIGARASKLSSTAGTIRKWEFTKALTDPNNAIRHALMVAINNSQLLRPNTDGYSTPGYQWPARGYDTGANTAYTGQVRMGMQFVLDPAFDIDVASPNLSNEGIALARALRDYGCYVGDRSTYVSLYAEQGSNSAACTRMKTDWQTTLLPKMVPVLNNSSVNVGGPGARVRPTAPIFVGS